MEINNLTTEGRNTNTEKIDIISNLEKIKLINEEDKKVSLAIEKKLNDISKFIDEATKVVKNGGRVIYIGAGTSGRLGILDASEILPTYGDGDTFIGLIAGGKKAVISPVEDAEDDKEAAIKDLKSISFSKNDILLGIAASGRTPYVISAIEYANSIGSISGSLATSSNAVISKVAKFPIEIEIGSETIVGSTRMKSGTAQKMVLNMISTSVMINMGKVYKNFMVDLVATNKKLKIRSMNMLKQIIDISDDEAKGMIKKANFSVKNAAVMYVKKCSLNDAIEIIKSNNGMLRGLL